MQYRGYRLFYRAEYLMIVISNRAGVDPSDHQATPNCEVEIYESIWSPERRLSIPRSESIISSNVLLRVPISEREAVEVQSSSDVGSVRLVGHSFGLWRVFMRASRGHN